MSDQPSPVSPADATGAPPQPLPAAGQHAEGHARPDRPGVLALPAAEGGCLSGLLVTDNPVRLVHDDPGRAPRTLLTRARGRNRVLLTLGQAPGRLEIHATEPGRWRFETEDLVLPGGLSPTDPTGGDAAPISPRLAGLAAELAAGGGTDRFWDEIARIGTPLRETAPDGTALLTFLYRGARRNVWMFNSPTGDHHPMDRLGDSDVWFATFPAPAGLRMAYRLAPDVPSLGSAPRIGPARRMAMLASARPDPLNPAQWPGGEAEPMARSSTLVLDGALPEPRRADPGGTRSLFAFRSRLLGSVRDITLWQADGAAETAPLLCIFDGESWGGRIGLPSLLAPLISEGRLPPLSVAFVHNVDTESRGRDLPANPLFARMMAEELLPALGARLGGLPGPERTLLAGASYGGLAAITVALDHPDRFGWALSLSGSVWWPAGARTPDMPHGPAAEDRDGRLEVVERLLARPPSPVRLRLAVGRLETARGGVGGILDSSLRLRDVARARGCDIRLETHVSGHDWFAWAPQLLSLLTAAIGTDPAG